ncbi:DNA-directed RNA polymerase (apicoplast) [Babesia ovis]|uniref:DNA-directed RNA polymerase n=1 Tax=Babesia ovis TaxID=5869 RepID=A0A9W5TDT2_BABOV|nr:DNA-directed RNA polymerase [Babesia ovis]
MYTFNTNYAILEKHTNFKSNTELYKSIQTHKNLNNTFMYYFHKYKNKFKLYKTITKETNLNKIDKLFEGRHTETNENICFYKSLTIIKGIYKANNNTIAVSVIPLSISNIKHIEYINSIDHKKSTIAFPLSVNDIINVNNYVYYIHQYGFIKNNNSYKSSFISLFYYFIGLFLAVLYLYRHNNIKILYSNLIVIVSKLSNFTSMNKMNKTKLKYTKIENIKIINIINNSFKLHNNAYSIEYKPYLVGLTRYTMSTAGILAKLSFQDTLKTLQSILIKNKVDWCVDTKSNLLASNFIPVGSGWYRYFINYNLNVFNF